MIPLRRRLARGAGIPFDRLTAIALILAAVLPAAALGMLVYSQVERALADDAVARTERAVDAATMHLQQEQGDLDALAGGYARWPVFQRMVAGRQWAAVDDDVLEFLVEQGAVAAGRVDVVGGTGDGAAVGEPLVTAALATVPSATVSPASASPVTPGAARVVPIGDAVYLVTSEPIADPATGQAIGRITLARRIDAVFSAELATLTGYAVTMAGPDGTADVATDAATKVEWAARRSAGNSMWSTSYASICQRRTVRFIFCATT